MMDILFKVALFLLFLIFLVALAIFLLSGGIGKIKVGSIKISGKTSLIKKILPSVAVVAAILVVIGIIFAVGGWLDNVPKTKNFKEGELVNHPEYFKTKGTVTHDASLVGSVEEAKKNNVSVYINKEQGYVRIYKECQVWNGQITIPSSSSNLEFDGGTGTVQFYFVPVSEDPTFQAFKSKKIGKPEGTFSPGVEFNAKKVKIINREYSHSGELWSLSLTENWEDIELDRYFIVIPNPGKSITFRITSVWDF